MTVVWIVWESVQRLLNPGVHVEVTWWAFAVMGISIAVDVSRSRRLAAVARKYRSQALEADALHFRTDIWSSCVVILGLGQVVLARAVPQLSFLEHGDSMAALAVAAIVAMVSLRLGWRALQALLDASPRGESVKRSSSRPRHWPAWSMRTTSASAVRAAPGSWTCT